VDAVFNAIRALGPHEAVLSSPSMISSDLGRLRTVGCGDNFQALQRDALGDAGHLVIDQRDDVLVEDVLLLVGEILEALNVIVQRSRLEHIAQRIELVAEALRAGQLAHDQRG